MCKKKKYRLSLIIVLLMVLAWMNRFVQDDAFISFRYARNLAEGYGLVWNIGERIEGYSNFLWTVCLVPAFWMDMDVVLYSYLLSLSAFVCTLLCSWRIAFYVWKDWRAGCLTVILLGTNFSFSSYATGGLETQFVTAWVMGSVWLLICWSKSKMQGWMLGAAMTSACAFMTRMDAILLLVPLWMVVIYNAWCANRRRDLMVPGFVGVGMVLTWLLWRYAYYGAWVPNTALIKISGYGMWMRGMAYIGLFYSIYGYVLVGPFCLKSFFLKARDEPIVGSLICVVVLWHLYVISIGGDFMEFRMLMPSLPLVLALLSGGILAMRRWQVVLAGLMICSIVQGTLKWDIPCVETKHELRQHVASWKDVADVLNAVLKTDKDYVKIGVTAAGVIPFYTGMPALDLLGLNDRDVAISGDQIPSLTSWLGQWPGHIKMAQGKQVLEKGVHLLLNKPWLISSEKMMGWTADRIRQRWMVEEDASEQHVAWQMPKWEDAHMFPVVAWPCGRDQYLITLYVQQNDWVDAAILRTGARIMK